MRRSARGRQLRGGGRARDGDMPAGRGRRVPPDGVIEVGGAAAACRDGIPDLRRDARTPQDIAAFERPPAGYNPYLFQIELDPLTDRRTAELFRLEPYVARGIRIGSFVLFPEAEIGAIVTNNIFRSPTRRRRQRAWRCAATCAWSRTGAGTPSSCAAAGLPPSTRSTRPRTTAPTRSRRAAGSTSPSAPTSRGWPLHQLDKDSAARPRPARRRRRARRHRDQPRGRRLQPPLQSAGPAAEGRPSPTWTSRPCPSSAAASSATTERNYTQREAALRTSWAAQPGRRLCRDRRQRSRVPCSAGRRHPALLARRALPCRRVVRALGRHRARRGERRLGPAGARRAAGSARSTASSSTPTWPGAPPRSPPSC